MAEFPKSIKNPSQLFQEPNGALRQMLKHSKELITLQSLIRDLLPTEVYVASLRQGQLHLITPSAAQATHIKYSQRTLIGALKRAKVPYQVRSVKVSVRPEFANLANKASPKPPKPLSSQNRRLISSTAKYIEDDALRKALIRLSERTQD